MNNEYEDENYMNIIFYSWKMNKYFLFGLNEYICEYNYEYFLFHIHF